MRYDKTFNQVATGESRTAEPSYVRAWRDYSRRRLMYAVSFLSFPFIALLLVWWQSPDSFTIVGPAWFVFALVSMIRFAAFRCPRCHKNFFATALMGNLFAKRCMNCGLSKWALSPSVDMRTVGSRGFRVTRRIWWRGMLCGALIGFVGGLVAEGWTARDWWSAPLLLIAIFILHPIMDRDSEQPFDSDMLRSWRIYVGIIVLAVEMGLLMHPVR